MARKLIDKPKVKEDFEKALTKFKEQKSLDPQKKVRDIIASDDVKEILLDILDQSFMSPTQKAYIKGVLIERLPERKVIKQIFGYDPGYHVEEHKLAMQRSKAVKEYMDIIKMIYINVVPVAQMTELEVMLSPYTKAETKLKAAKDIQDRAGLTKDGEDTKTKLPVTLIINMPGANPTQINNEEVINTP